jgi:kumamolisin
MLLRRQARSRDTVNDEFIVKDGTSAAAPLWAGLIALANAARGAPLGFMHTLLYNNPMLCGQVSQGNNRIDGLGYDAGGSWNACTGLGVPRGRGIIAAASAVA